MRDSTERTGLSQGSRVLYKFVFIENETTERIFFFFANWRKKNFSYPTVETKHLVNDEFDATQTKFATTPGHEIAN